MRKIILSVRSGAVALDIIEKAKKTTGVTYTKKYLAGGHTHVLISGDFSEEVEKELCGKYKNKATMNAKD